jgi:hypothetical protein
MTPENSLLGECECIVFQTLLPDEQELNRKYRQLAKSDSVETPGVDASLCGECIRNKKIQEIIAAMERSRV